MMKKLLFTLIMLIGVSCVYAQGTYYWVGGVGPISFTSNSNWNTALDGSGSFRTDANAADILIFDGSNVGGENNTQGAVVAMSGGTNFAQLILRNNVEVTIERNAVAGTSNIAVNGDGTVVDDLQIHAGSVLTIKPSGLDLTGAVALNLAATATGKIEGILNINGGGSRITSLNTSGNGAVFFENGSVCNVKTELSGQYPFGANANKGIVFKEGSVLKYLGGTSFFSQTAANEPLVLQHGSTCIFATQISAQVWSTSTNGYVAGSTASHFFNTRSYANVVVSENTTLTAGNFYNIDNLTIESGSTFLLNGIGVSPFSGNIVNDGTFGVNGTIGTTNLLLKGTSPQTISGTGTFNDLGAITIAADADVTLRASLKIAGAALSSVLGKLDFGLYEIRGIGTVTNSGRLQFRGAVSGNTTNEAAISEGNHVVTISTTEGYSTLNPVVGLLVTGPQIPANTYVIGTNSSNRQITLSNAPTGSGTTITVSSNNPTIKTANPTGVDGSITINSNGTLNFSAGTNYIFDAATTTPFPADGNSNLGDVTFNAPATTNKDVNIAGTLTLNNSKLIIGDGKAVNMSPTASFGGTFNQNNYIVTEANATTGTSGKLVVNDIGASILVPVGTLTNYTPVTLHPTSSSTFEIHVFEGITADATPNGTALSAGAKNNLVNAVWNINRTAGSGDSEVTLGWQAALEGTDFANLANAEIGIAQYLNGAYTSYTGSGDNTLNTATVVLNEFGPLSVGKIGSLPVELLSFLVQKNGASVQISWSTAAEQNNSHYDIEHSANGKIFNVIGTKAGAVNSATLRNYIFIDHKPQAGVNYYRLVQYDLNGKATVYNPQVVNISAGSVLRIYSTSSSIHVSIDEDEVSRGNFMLYSADGKKIFTQSLQLNKGVNAFEVNTSDLKPGVYIASYANENKVVTEKFIK